MISSRTLQSRRTPVGTAMAVVLLAFLAIAIVGLTADVAAAHSDLASSTPQNGETVHAAISEVELVFASPIDFDSSSFEVVDGSGETISITATSIAADDVTVTIELAQPVYHSAVGVGYTIVADDSHPRSGSITFVVDAPLPTPTPPTAPAVSPAPTEAPLSAAPQPTAESTAEQPAIASVPTEPKLAPAPDLAVAAESSLVDSAEIAQPAPVGAVSETDDDIAAAPIPDLSDFLGPSATFDRMVNAQTVVRGAGYAAGVGLVGSLFFFARIAGARPAGLRRRVIQVSALATALSGIALIALQAGITNGGSFGAAMNPVDWAGELGGWFGAGVLLRVIGGLFGLTVASTVSQLTVLCVVATVVSFPFLGHGVSRDPWWLVFPADLVHVAVVSVWTGGLLMLVLGLRRQGAAPASDTREMVERFSTIAGWAVAAAAVTGVVLAATELQSFGDVFSTTYGKRLVLKSVLVGGVVGLGAVHRFRLIPALRDSGDDSITQRKIVTTGSIEVVAMGAVLVVTTLLVNAAT